MSDETMINEEVNTTTTDELELLKARADLMGIKYHPSVKADRLRLKIENALSLSSDEEEEKEAPVNSRSLINERRKQAAKLIRIRVTCMNPGKKNWPGEIISVGSAALGTFKKYVPFNVEDGWHVPNIIYEIMKERKCTVFHTVKGPRGNSTRKGKLVPEFAIEVLPPLTEKELADLRQRQAMSGSIDRE